MQNKEWIERQNSTPERRRTYEQERLIIEVFEELARSMDDAGLTKAKLAEALGTSRANITQLFSGQRNATLRTIADLAWACNMRVSVALERLREDEFIGAPIRMVSIKKPRMTFESPKEVTPEGALPGLAA